MKRTKTKNISKDYLETEDVSRIGFLGGNASDRFQYGIKIMKKGYEEAEKNTVKLIRKRFKEHKKSHDEHVKVHMEAMTNFYNGPWHFSKFWYERIPIIGDLIFKRRINRIPRDNGVTTVDGDYVTFKASYPVSKKK